MKKACRFLCGMPFWRFERTRLTEDSGRLVGGFDRSCTRQFLMTAPAAESCPVQGAAGTVFTAEETGETRGIAKNVRICYNSYKK
jgi:hypothetical protein